MKVNRRQYYRVLAQADPSRTQDGHQPPLLNFVGRAIERSLTLYLEASTPRPSPPSNQDRWILLRDAAQHVSVSLEYLSLLARTGRLEAVKRGRKWYTTHRAIESYQQSLR